MQNDEKKDLKKGLYLFISVLVAITIWLFVDQISGPNGGPQTAVRTIEEIPIEYLNESGLENKGLMMLDEGTDTSIDLTVEGTRWLVSNLDPSDIRVTVDLGTVVGAGRRNLLYEINYPDPRFSNNNLTITKASIYSASVNISELFHKTVDIRCELKGNVANGFSAGQVQLSHRKVSLQGQESAVAPISYAKVIFDIGRNAEETVSKSIALKFYDERGNEVDVTDVRTDVTAVQATLPVFVTKELTLAMNFVEAPGASKRNLTYEIQPKTIIVSGDAGKLKNVNTIVLDELELLTLSEGINTYTYPITVPSGCQNLSGVTRATLVISFTDMVRAGIPTNRFRCENLPAGRIVDVLTEQVVVEVFGTSEDVEALTGENIIVSADLSAFGSALGTYTVPVTIECETDGDIGITGTYEIQVTIRDPLEETEDTEEPGDPSAPDAPENGAAPESEANPTRN